MAQTWDLESPGGLLTCPCVWGPGQEDLNRGARTVGPPPSFSCGQLLIVIEDTEYLNRLLIQWLLSKWQILAVECTSLEGKKKKKENIIKLLLHLGGKSGRRLVVWSDSWRPEWYLVIGDVTKIDHSFSIFEYEHYSWFHCRKQKWTRTRSWSPQMPCLILLTPKTRLWRNGPWVDAYV